MRRFALLLVGLVLVGISSAEQPEVRLPSPAWKKLGLTNHQLEELRKIRAECKAQIDVIETQMKKVREAEIAKAREVLTPAQREKLQQLLTDQKP